jgi:molybdopterin/thiamine biosynthesis adenylyltransferase
MDTYRVILIGAGGIGSWLAHGLVRMLEWRAPGSALIIIDGDNYEEKNKERQALNGAGNKAEVLAYELSPQFPSTMIIPQALWVVEETSNGSNEEDVNEDGTPAAGKIAAKDLLQDNDIIYAVVDNDAARKTVFQAAANLNDVDVFTGGNDENFFGSVTHYRRRNGSDVTRNPLEYSPEYANPNDRNPGDMSCQERAEIEGGTQLIGTNMAVASYLLARTQKVILEDLEVTESQIYFDLGVGMAQPYDRSVATETISV